MNTDRILAKLTKAGLLLSEAVEKFKQDPPRAVSADKLVNTAVEEIRGAQALPDYVAAKLLVVDRVSGEQLQD